MLPRKCSIKNEIFIINPVFFSPVFKDGNGKSRKAVASNDIVSTFQRLEDVKWFRNGSLGEKKRYDDSGRMGYKIIINWRPLRTFRRFFKGSWF